MEETRTRPVLTCVKCKQKGGKMWFTGTAFHCEKCYQGEKA